MMISYVAIASMGHRKCDLNSTAWSSGNKKASLAGQPAVTPTQSAHCVMICVTITEITLAVTSLCPGSHFCGLYLGMRVDLVRRSTLLGSWVEARQILSSHVKSYGLELLCGGC